MAIKRKIFQDFDGGLRTNGDKAKIKDNESPDLENVVVTGSGNLIVRKGSTKVFDETASYATKPVTMLANYKTSTGTDEILVAYGGLVKLLDLDTGVLTDLPTPITGFNDTARYGFGIYNDKAYFCNGVNGFVEYDGSANNVRTLTNLAAAAFLTNAFTFKDRKMYAIDYGNKTLLHRSKTDGGTAADIYTFDYAGGATLENSGTTSVKEGGTPLSGIQVLDDLYVFSRNNIFTLVYQELNTSTLFVLDNISRGAGAENNESTIASGDALLFFDPVDRAMSQLGQRQNYPGILVNGISDKIRNLTQGEYDFSEATSIYWKRMYLTACKSSTSQPANDIVLLFDLETRSIFKITGWFVNCWMENNNKLYYGSSIAPIVYEAFSGYDDDGGEINAYFYSREDFFGDPSLQKDADYLHVDGTIDEEMKIRVEMIFDDGRDAIVKDIDGSNTDYIIDTDTSGVRGENVRGKYMRGGTGEESDRIFSVWLRIKGRKWRSLQIKISTLSGVGKWSIRFMQPINVRAVTEEPPSIRKI